MNKVTATYILALGLLTVSLGLPHAARGQDIGQVTTEDLLVTKGRFGDAFMSRYEAPYLNYGWIDYENYREGIPIFKRYDAFGSYLTEGYEVFRMEEFRAAQPGTGGSTLLKGRFFQNWLRHLVIADDAYGGWSTRITVGDAIRTTFSPLTLDLARFNGIRWDEASPNNRVTFILSRLSDPIKLDLKNQLGPGGKRAEVDDGLYLFGGHWESHLGDFLVLGGTYLNLHRFDATRGYTTNSRKGLAPPFTTARQVIVRFEDDSPDDGIGGAMVFDIIGSARIREDGEIRFEEIRPAQVDMSDGVLEDSGHLEASGRFEDRDDLLRPVFIDYIFAVPDSTEGITFSAVVANDYRISVRQNHDFDNLSRNRIDAGSTKFAMVRRAEENIIDQSNKRQVTFDHGMQTGFEIFGVDMRLNVGGFRIKGEIARSTNYMQFAAAKGDRSSFEDYASYVTVDKTVAGVSLGFERFRIGPKYTGYTTKSPARINAEASPTLGQDGVKLNLADLRTMGSTFHFNTARQDPVSTDGTEGGNRTLDPIYALVDDNDDMDQWPDDWVQDWDVANREIKYLESDAGIYPFFDFDADGFPDNNRNRNQLLDSDEPFLMYFTDPREFYFGDDFNNNLILDAWEDDDQPNYPYFKDEDGLHVIAAFEPLKDLRLTAGRYDVEQIAGGGGNEVTYGRLRYERELGAHWWFRFDHEAKDVNDDIANPHFDFKVLALSDGRLIPQQFFFPDELQARDSFINRGLLHIKFRPRPGLNVNGKFRYENNHQRESSSQGEDDVDFRGLLVKADYTRHFGSLAFMPRVKFQYQRRERDSVGEAFLRELLVVPIIRLDYRLTARTQIRIGAQGLPLWPDRRLDIRDRDNDNSRRTYVVTWFNHSDYQGYKVGTELGVEYNSVDFDVRGLSDESYMRLFVRMIAGVGRRGNMAGGF